MISDTLNDREKTYGPFGDNARLAQTFKAIFRAAPAWASMTDVQRESLELTATKLGRLLNGDPSYGDTWHDISGYMTLAVEELDQGAALRGRTVEDDPIDRAQRAVEEALQPSEFLETPMFLRQPRAAE